MKQLTADAIHNWDSPYIMRDYMHMPDEVKIADAKAFRSHHQRGTDAQVEADQMNRAFNL